MTLTISRSRLKRMTVEEMDTLLLLHHDEHGTFPEPASVDALADRSGYRAFQKEYFDSFDGFLTDCINWPQKEGKPGAANHYQLEIAGEFRTSERIAVRGPHGIGKTAIAALAVIWFALTRDGLDWKCATTASKWRQLKLYLWPEIHKWVRHVDWEKVGRPSFSLTTELLTLQINLSTGSAFAVASDDPSGIEGVHADHVLYVFDEGKAIPKETWDAAEGAFSGAGADTEQSAKALAISTPGDEEGRFHEIHAKEEGLEEWKTLHVTLEDAIKAGRVSREWAEKRKRQWGENSALYRNRVLGEFAAQGVVGVIPLDWVEAAIDRWRDLDEAGQIPTDVEAIGVDVADGGEDLSTIARRFKNIISRIEKVVQDKRGQTMAVAGRAKAIYDAHGCGIVVDNGGGYGAGPISRLREQGVPCVAFEPSGRTTWTDQSGELRFKNQRAAAWWKMRDLLDPNLGRNIALPPDDEGRLLKELTTPRWKQLSTGEILVEPKEEVKKRLGGKSTDYADPVIQVFWTTGTASIAGLAPGETPEEAEARREQDADRDPFAGGGSRDEYW